jgi:hypothetical protein
MREAFLETKNVFKSAPEITFWAGQRFYMQVNQFTNTLVRHWSSAASLAPIFALSVVLETGCSSTGVGYQTGQTSPVTSGNASVERNAANRNRKLVSQTAPEAKPDRRIDTCNPAFSSATISRL